MAEVKYVGVRFKKAGKIYYFSPEDYKVNVGDKVIVETVRGVECGDVVLGERTMDESELSSPLKPLIRIADDKDLEQLEHNKKKEKEAFEICREKISKHGLKMDLVDVECTFDNNKLLFYFTAKNRVDFRELVKDLAGVFHTRIELRQIGVRDEAKLLGGLGICGQQFCCSRFLGDFQPVSVKMAKEQSLSLNPTKLSGSCGRLMCCLKFESDVYVELLKVTPKVGAVVKTAEGKGTVVDVNLLTGTLKVKADKDEKIYAFKKDEVELIKDGVVKLDKNELRALRGLEGK